MKTASIPEYRVEAILVNPAERYIPAEFHHYIQSYIYNTSSKAREMHSQPHCFRGFCFSFLPATRGRRNQNHEIKDENDCYVLRVSSVFPQILQDIENNLWQNGGITIGDAILSLQQIYRVPFQYSGIYHYYLVNIYEYLDKGKNYARSILPSEYQKFKEAIEKATKNRWQIFTGSEPPEFQITFLSRPLYRGEIYMGKKLIGCSGKMEIKGDKEFLKFVQAVGIGSNNAKGFGFIT